LSAVYADPPVEKGDASAESNEMPEARTKVVEPITPSGMIEVQRFFRTFKLNKLTWLFDKIIMNRL